MMMRPKKQRLVLVVISLVALGGAALLALWGLQGQAAYFVTPSEIRAGKVATGEALRLGGMVSEGSLERKADGVTVSFLVGDEKAEVPVSYTGILPDLFREGSGMVAEGRLDADGTFHADTILAKHDERYMPPPMAKAQAAGETLAQ